MRYRVFVPDKDDWGGKEFEPCLESDSLKDCKDILEEYLKKHPGEIGAWRIMDTNDKRYAIIESSWYRGNK